MKKKVKVISKKKMHTKKEEKLEIHNEENIDNGRIKWSLQIVDINKLKPYEKNPRIITEEALLELENSFNEIGMCQPLVVSNDLSIISGNARYLQLKKEGCNEVQVMIPDRKLTEKQEKAVVIRMNKTNVGKWDFDSLANNYEIIDLMDWGFTTEELVGVEEEKIEGKCDEDEVPVIKDTITKRGDIWLLGNHRVMCGDSTMIDDIKALCQGLIPEMVFTDPPYELQIEGGGILNKKAEKLMREILDNGVDSFDPSVLIPLAKVHVFFHNKPLIKSYIELSEKWEMSYDLAVYKKNNPIPNSKGHLITDLEYIAIIGNLDPNRGLEVDDYSKLWCGNKDKDNSLSYSKPVELCEKFIKLYSNLNVLDLFLGSGSTLIACEKTNRKCYGMELDEHYCDVIINRYMKFTGRDDVYLESTGEKYSDIKK